MKVEYLINKSDYKDLLPKGNFTATNELIVKKRSNTVKGKDNYLLTLKVLDETEKGAEALSEYHIQIKQILLDNKITFRILLNEAAQYFAKDLFPLLCEFETKLRKFIQSAMFDINEQAEQEIISRLKKFEIIKKEDNVLSENFLEFSDLGEIIDFLFSNDELYKEFENYKKKQGNIYRTKEDLIKFIENSDKQRVWDKYFSENFSDSILPEKIFEIKGYRNDVMHFHEIDGEKYSNAKNAIKLVIADLDKQLKKGIVLEPSDEIVQTIASNPNYFASVGKVLASVYNYLSSEKMVENIQNALKLYANLSSTYLLRMETVDWDKYKGYFRDVAELAVDKYTEENLEENKKETMTEEDSEEDKKDGE